MDWTMDWTGLDWTMDWTMNWTMDWTGLWTGLWTGRICAKTWTMDDFYLATAVSTNSISANSVFGYHFVTIDTILSI